MAAVKYATIGTRKERSRQPVNAAFYRKTVMKLALADSPRVVVEVGIFAGVLSRMLVTLPSLEKLFIVDPWDIDYRLCGDVDMEAVAQGVMAWAATEPKVAVLRQRSVEAASRFQDESVDFWHTDGDHSLKGVTDDIKVWLPKVKLGGILSGDNYEMPTVAAAVDEQLPERKLAARGRLWWARKSN